jgi:coenzyme PQQ precursor peptide PqqA
VTRRSIFDAAARPRPVTAPSVLPIEAWDGFWYDCFGPPLTLEKTMWSKPEYTELRFGFEVTMYIANR